MVWIAGLAGDAPHLEPGLYLLRHLRMRANFGSADLTAKLRPAARRASPLYHLNEPTPHHLRMLAPIFGSPLFQQIHWFFRFIPDLVKRFTRAGIPGVLLS